jgi:hypothetical protein
MGVEIGDVRNRTSARISVSSGRGFAGAQASLPSGAMITLRPPRRFQVIEIKTVMVSPSKAQVFPLLFARDFLLPSGTVWCGVFPLQNSEVCLSWHTTPSRTGCSIHTVWP